MDRLLVATLNIRALMDRWAERLPLLLADMAALQPDLLGLQEVVYPMQQDRLIAAAGEGRYTIRRGPSARPEYGNSILVREPLEPSGLERIDLGLGRQAGRVSVALPSGGTAVFVTTHLHHPVDAAADRDAQVETLVRWLAGLDDAVALIVTGDFNAPPREAAYGRMTQAGFRSAHVEANGAEPALTWPSGIVADGMDTEGDPECLDYVWLRGPVRAARCRLVFDRPAVDDPTLYPSDHLGLAALVEIDGSTAA
jgi:endonuclease/exonuclease/phosphatase family metal-dependent hydrolase